MRVYAQAKSVKREEVPVTLAVLSFLLFPLHLIEASSEQKGRETKGFDEQVNKESMP